MTITALAAVGELLVVHQQEPAGNLHLVRVGVRWCGPLGGQDRVLGVGDVQDGRAHSAVPGVAQVEDWPLAEDLHAVTVAAEVMMGEQAQSSSAQRAGGHAGSVSTRCTLAQACE